MKKRPSEILSSSDDFNESRYILELIINKIDSYIDANECLGKQDFLNYIPVYFKYVLSENTNNVDMDSSAYNDILCNMYREVFSFAHTENIKHKYMVLNSMLELATMIK